MPGEKKRIGPAAAKDYEKRKARGEIPVATIPDDMNCDLEQSLPPGRARGVRASDLILGAAALTPVAIKVGKEIRDEVTSRDRP